MCEPVKKDPTTFDVESDEESSVTYGDDTDTSDSDTSDVEEEGEFWQSEFEFVRRVFYHHQMNFDSLTKRVMAVDAMMTNDVNCTTTYHREQVGKLMDHWIIIETASAMARLYINRIEQCNEGNPSTFQSLKEEMERIMDTVNLLRFDVVCAEEQRGSPSSTKRQRTH